MDRIHTVSLNLLPIVACKLRKRGAIIRLCLRLRRGFQCCKYSYVEDVVRDIFSRITNPTSFYQKFRSDYEKECEVANMVIPSQLNGHKLQVHNPVCLIIDLTTTHPHSCEFHQEISIKPTCAIVEILRGHRRWNLGGFFA